MCDCGNKAKILAASLNKSGGTRSCGCLKKTHFIDLTGQTFNNLTIVSYFGKDKSNNHTYNCICKCGSKSVHQGSDVKTGKIQGCGKCDLPMLPDNEGLYNSLYAMYRNKAETRGHNFNLDKEFFRHEISKNCFYCNREPSNRKRNSSKHHPAAIYYSSLDRVDNNKGYQPDNVVPACQTCNQAKHTLSLNEFLSWVSRISSFQKTKEESFF